MSLKNRIEKIVLRNQVRGVTARQTFTKLTKEMTREGNIAPSYATVRARLYELANDGAIYRDNNGSVARFF
jgi:hypothetical protein